MGSLRIAQVGIRADHRCLVQWLLARLSQLDALATGGGNWNATTFYERPNNIRVNLSLADQECPSQGTNAPRSFGPGLGLDKVRVIRALVLATGP